MGSCFSSDDAKISNNTPIINETITIDKLQNRHNDTQIIKIPLKNKEQILSLISSEQNKSPNAEQLQIIEAIFKDTLENIKAHSQSSEENKHVFTQQTIGKIVNDAQSHYFKNQEVQWFLKFISEYKKICLLAKEEKNFQQVIDKMGQLGQDYSKNINDIKFRHYKAIKILEKLFSAHINSNTINLNTLSFELRNKDQILLVSKIVKICCEHDLNCFFFLSTYLRQCCLRATSSENQTIVEIEKQLFDVLDFLRKQHPPNDSKPTGDTKIQTENLQKIKHSLKINLKDINPTERNQKLQEFIIQVAQIAKKNQNQLISLTKRACYKNNGMEYKTGLKVKSKKNKSSIDRVKEKLLSKHFEKYKLHGQAKNLLQILEKQIDQYHQTTAQIFNSKAEQIQFSVGDMLRGKCMFQSIEDIKKAAKQILQNTKQKKYPIEMDNRLSEKTTDLVFKIKIGDIIAEFQLAYKFNVVKNEFNHKIYELARSKFYSCLNTLFIFNESSSDFFLQLLCRVKKLEQKKMQTRIKMQEKQILEQIQKLRQRYEIFLYERKYNLSNELQTAQKIWNKMINIVKTVFQVNKNKNQQKDVNTQVQVYRLYWNGVFLKKNQKLHETIQNFKKIKELIRQHKDKIQYVLKFDQNLDFEIAQNLRKVGNLKESLEWLQNILKYQKEQNCVKVYNEIGLVYSQQKNYHQAIQNYKKSLSIASQNQQANNVEHVLSNIGLAYQNIGNYDEALNSYNKSLQIYTDKSGQQSFIVGQILNNIGGLHMIKGNNNEAINFFEKCLKIQTAIKGQSNIAVATTLNNIACAYQNLSNYSQSLKIYEKCLKINISIVGYQSNEVAVILNNIGTAYQNLGNYAQALKKFEQSQKIRIILNGQQSKDVATSLNNIAGIYMHQKNYSEAIKTYEKCLKILNDESIQSAKTMYNLAAAHLKKQNQIEALKYYQKSLRIFVHFFGNQQNAIVKKIKQKISQLHQKLREQQQSDLNLQVSIDLTQEKDISLAEFYLSYSQIYMQLQNYPAALKGYKKCLKIYMNSLGQQCYEVGKILLQMSLLQLKLQNNSDAQQNYTKAEKILTITKQQQNKQIGYIYNDIASYYYDKDKYNEAIINLEKQLKILISNLGEQHKDVGQILQQIAKCYYNFKKNQEALIFYQKSLPIIIAVYGQQSQECVNCLNSIAVCYYLLKKYQDSINLFERMTKIVKIVFGQQSLRLVLTIQNIGFIYFQLKNYLQAINRYEQTIPILMTLQDQSSKLVQNTSKIALAYFFLQKYSQSLKLYEKSLKIHLSKSCEQTSQTAVLIYGIGACHQKLNNFQQALKNFQKCFQIWKLIKQQGTEIYAKCLFRSGQCYKSMSNYSEALTYFKKALQIRQKLFDSNNENVKQIYQQIDEMKLQKVQ